MRNLYTINIETFTNCKQNKTINHVVTSCRYIIRIHNLSKYEIERIIIVLIIKYYEKKSDHIRARINAHVTCLINIKN